MFADPRKAATDPSKFKGYPRQAASLSTILPLSNSNVCVGVCAVLSSFCGCIWRDLCTSRTHDSGPAGSCVSFACQRAGSKQSAIHRQDQRHGTFDWTSIQNGCRSLLC